ncbi:MAG TPA: PilN domain-containing protein [Terriglobales bacterium]|nr:PilN domain-containing protein [Terriglobales bacterium]
MRLNINLATQPYQDVRRFLFRWGIVVAVLAAVTFGLVYAAVSATIAWRSVSRQENELRAQIAERDRVRASAEAFLNRPENRSTRDESQFINTLIARKAFSWTQVLSDLERIVPAGLQVTTIRPEITEDNQLELRLVVAGQSRDRAIDLVRRLEGAAHFRNAAVINEAAPNLANSGSSEFKFEISAVYVPSFELGTPQTAQTQQGGQ